MNRALIITTGIVIILLVLSVWVYLMLFGAPKSGGEVFANLGFKMPSQEVTITPPVVGTALPEVKVDTSGEALQQLTVRPVAGFILLENASSSIVRYAERGTGYIYDIDLNSGTEITVSKTTVPQTAQAVFSPSGNSVALTAYTQYSTSVFAGSIDMKNNTLVGVQLPPGAENITFESDTQILYTVTQNGNTTGYRFNTDSGTRAELFSFNYSNLDVAWGPELEKIYLATKPAYNLEGYIYYTVNNTLTPATPSAFGLSAFFSNPYIVLTFTENNRYVSYAQASDDTFYKLPIVALKEKCVFDRFAEDYLWCASPIETDTPTYVEDWYKGLVTANDYLWLVDIQGGKAKLFEDFQKISGRTIDVMDLQINSSGSALAFINKLDQTLWHYSLTAE